MQCFSCWKFIGLHPLIRVNTPNVIPVCSQGALPCSPIRELRNQPLWKWWRLRPPDWPRTPTSKLPPRWRSQPWRGRDRWPDLTNSNTGTWTSLHPLDSERTPYIHLSCTHSEPVAGLPSLSFPCAVLLLGHCSSNCFSLHRRIFLLVSKVSGHPQMSCECVWALLLVQLSFVSLLFAF